MMFSLYSKTSGCEYCDRAKDLLDARGLAYETRSFDTISELKDAIQHVAPTAINTFPVIFRDGVHVGGFVNLRDMLDEPVLSHDNERLAAFPIEHPVIYELYKRHVASFWTSDEISLTDDITGFDSLTSDERRFVLHVLAFFSQADGIVLKNIDMNFSNDVTLFESKMFYAIQSFMESEHAITYSQLIDSLVTDSTERMQLLDAIEHIPAVRDKAEWASRWLDRSRSFAERLVAFACVEGILFSGSFCAIFWLKTRVSIPGLSLSNQFIARDEKMHVDHAIALFHQLKHKPGRGVVTSIVTEAVENEIKFITDAIPNGLVGMNSELMTTYIKFVADQLMTDLGFAPIYDCRCPFSFMQTLGLEGKTNFFESRASEYARAGVAHVATEPDASGTSDEDDF